MEWQPKVGCCSQTSEICSAKANLNLCSVIVAENIAAMLPLCCRDWPALEWQGNLDVLSGFQRYILDLAQINAWFLCQSKSITGQQLTETEKPKTYLTWLLQLLHDGTLWKHWCLLFATGEATAFQAKGDSFVRSFMQALMQPYICSCLDVKTLAWPDRVDCPELPA